MSSPVRCLALCWAGSWQWGRGSKLAELVNGGLNESDLHDSAHLLWPPQQFPFAFNCFLSYSAHICVFPFPFTGPLRRKLMFKRALWPVIKWHSETAIWILFAITVPLRGVEHHQLHTRGTLLQPFRRKEFLRCWWQSPHLHRAHQAAGALQASNTFGVLCIKNVFPFLFYLQFYLWLCETI